jgi:hypothetical protein
LSQTRNKLIEHKALSIILGLGFAFKLLYLFFIGPAVFNNWALTTQDSFSYTNSFINLVNTGEYTHDTRFSEAAFGRLPVVAFIWGFFYLLFGQVNAYAAFAVFQILLDILAAYLVYKLFSKLFYEKVALIVSFAYVFFPLTIYFVVKTDTEYLALFLIIVVLYKLVHFKNDLKNCLLLAVFLVLGFYTRETLLLLIPISFFYLWRNYDLSLKKYFSISLLMFVLYLPWPVRNYLKSEQLILIHPLSAGYADYQKDMLGYMYWLYAWHSDQPDEYLAYSYRLGTEIKFPDEIFASESEKQLAINTIQLAQRCGTSFVEWQREAGKKTKCYGCYDDLIKSSFVLLKHSYKVNHPFIYYIKIPLQNLSKAFLKTSLTNSEEVSDVMFKSVMLARSLLLFIGVWACFYYRKLDYFNVTFIFLSIQYLFIVAILRQVEMRYLFQADVLILLAAVAFLADKFFKRKTEEKSY